MKKYLFLVLIMLFTAGCSFKNQVKDYQYELTFYTPEELADIILREVKNKIPYEKESKKGNYVLSINEAYREKNEVHIISKVDSIDRSIPIKGIDRNPTTKEIKMINEVFCLDAPVRAMINLGLVINFKIELENKNHLIKIDEQSCKKYFD